MINSKKIRVLIAEDDYLVSREISNTLDKIGYENIGTATNGKIAVEMACSQKPDVVLMDIKMPELNGFEATKEIQKRCKIPVVILTAFESEEFIEKAKKMGIYAYILKPPIPNEIKRNISIALARHNDLMECNHLNEALQHEITKRKKADQKLQQHTIELQERNEELDAFAHTVAHDLKVPLSTVIGFSDLLSEDYSNLSDDEITSYIATISQDSYKMNHIIDELLLLSSLRKAEVKLSPLNMNEIVTEAIERLSQIIDY
jgi:DNA-binding NarL/FixJ family response regulator